jgi:SpoVK/Ycf46/Vps4 family AAA+-type ATPase
MLAKAIATGFNSPIVTVPGSGFAQSFLGMDAVIVRWMARKAKRLARKWGGQCIVFIDEIDAVGLRRQALGGAAPGMSAQPTSFHDLCFYGPNGALTPTEDLILESRAWRERLFASRAPAPRGPHPLVSRLGGLVNQAVPGMFGGGGQLALNQLLVVMDGIDNPPFLRRVLNNRVNTFLDATYVVPPRIGRLPLRLPQARPTGDQIYFIGASARPTCRWTCWTRRSPAPAGWAATSGSARRRRRTGWTSSTSTSARSRTRRTWTRRGAETSWRG